MENEEDKKAARAAVNALVKTGNKDLVDLGLSMLPQEDKDNLAAITDNIRKSVAYAEELIAEYPRLKQWLSDEKISTVVPGGWFTVSDAIDMLRGSTGDNKEKIALFFDTIVLDDEALNISMMYLCTLPLLLDNFREQTDLTEDEIDEYIYIDFAEKLHAVPHVKGFPDTPETLRAALRAVFSDKR